jgi:hypothetical protein
MLFSGNESSISCLAPDDPGTVFVFRSKKTNTILQRQNILSVPISGLLFCRVP